MPLYNYTCEDCGEFSCFKGMEQRNEPTICPLCSKVSKRLILAPNLAMMNPVVRKAAAVNEKSRHEPRVRESHSCGSGCGCGTKIRPQRTRETKLGKLEGQKPTARPWMLGH